MGQTGLSSRIKLMTYYTKETSLKVAILGLNCDYTDITDPFSFSNAIGNLSVTVSGSDNDNITLENGRYVLYAIPYCSTTAAVSFILQTNQNGSFQNIGDNGTIPITTDGTGQNSAAVASLTVHESCQIRLVLTALGGAATDIGGYIRIMRSRL